MAKKIIKAQMMQRRDTKANWAAQNPVLLSGELGIVSDDPNLYKVGDGTTAWNALPFRGFDGTLVHTTGDSETAAMSQKGVTKELAKLSEETRQVSHIANAIVENIELTPSTDNLIDTFSVAYLLPDSGKFYARTDVRSIYGKVKPNTLYTIDNKTTGNRFSVFTSEDKPSAGVDYTNRIDFAGLEQGTITTGASDNYMLIYLQSTDEDVDYSNYRIYEGVEFVKGKSKVDGLSEQLNELVRKEESVEDNLFPSINLFNGEYDEGFWQASGFYPYIGYYVTKPIKIEGGKSYKYPSNSVSYGNNFPNYAVYDLSGNFVKVKNATTEGAFEILTEESDCLVSVNIGSSLMERETFMFAEASQYPETYLPYMKLLKKGLYVSQEAISSPLLGKILAVDGDSICYGAGNTGGYGKILAERNGMTLENLSVSGGTITAETYNESGEARHWICRSVANLRKDADYIIIEGGANDAETMGAYSDSYSGDYDSTTFYGALDTMCKALYDHFGGKKVGFIIVHQVPLFKPDSLKVQAIKKVLAKWGIPYLDLNALCPPFGLLPSENSLRTTYTHNGDGWHPNEEGYKKYYCDKIEAFMLSL